MVPALQAMGTTAVKGTSVRKVVLLFVGCLSLSIRPTIAASDDLHRFGVGGTAILCPPSSDLDPSLIPYNDESTDLAVGSGHTPGFGFLFEAKVVQNDISSGTFKVFPKLDPIRHVNTLGGSIGFLSRPDSLRLGSAMRARDLSDEWHQTGRCTHATVTSIGYGSVFEVKCSAGDNYSNVINVAPDKNIAMPDANSIMIASCNDENIPAGPFKGTTLHSCRRVVTRSGFLLDYQIQKENLPLYQQIDAFLDGKIGAWKLNCSQ